MITRCGREEVLAITGCGVAGYKFVHPRSFALVLPGQRMHRLSIQGVTLTVETKEVVTKNGAPICIVCQVQVKINRDNAEMLRNAAERFWGKSEEEVKRIVQECVATCQTAIIADFTPEDMKNERKKVSWALYNASQDALYQFGMGVVFTNVKDVWDNHGYFLELGRARREEVLRQAAEEEKKEKMRTLVNQKDVQRELEAMKLVVEREEQETVEQMRMGEEEKEQETTKQDEHTGGQAL
ncbi:flotillin-1-like [Babylonia areolata]|uniref:flotillin-1-like n=1 Tax=Babylonia areolata TaxID=304850 RepID=UPI003FD400BD